MTADRSGAEAFRTFMSTFCTGVAVVTAFDRTARPHGLTCTSLASVTLRPPTLMVCLNVASGTLDAIADSGRFAVNLLHERGRQAAELFASADPDRFDRVRWRTSLATGQPLLADDAYATAECRTNGTALVGDHAVVFGEIVHIEQTDAEVPLLYGMRTFSRWPRTKAVRTA
jgi:flavin reductase (DIM6/NTAB) family NADH-FMN oxidoreductase RutF